MPAVNFGGIFMVTDSRAELAERAVVDCLAARNNPKLKPKIIFDSNGQGLALYHTNKQFRDAIDNADLVHADGGFIVALSGFLSGAKIKERSATTDMVHDVAKCFEKEGMSFYLLGGDEEVNKKAVDALLKIYPKLKIVGRRNGFFNSDEEDEIIDEINALSPDLLWVGLGKPKEQIFALKHKNKLNCGWVVTSGGCFNFLAGDYKRAPKWMQDNSIEWIYRLVTNPKMLFWRYFWTNPYALYLALRYSTKEIKDA